MPLLKDALLIFAKLTADGNHKPDSFFFLFPTAFSNASDLMRTFAFQPLGLFLEVNRVDMSYKATVGSLLATTAATFSHSPSPAFRHMLTVSCKFTYSECYASSTSHTHTHTRTRLHPLKYAVAWLLLSFLISCVIEWGLLSGQLHGNDYFAGHLWPSSAWLNVMDGEEMVMSETLPSPARSQPLYNYSHTVWLSPNRTPSTGDSLKICTLTTPMPPINTFIELMC